MVEQKRVVVTGASGGIGRALCTRLQERGYAVVVFSRDPQAASQQVPGANEYVAWTAAESGPWAAAVDGAYAVIHLAGVNNFARRWNATFKQQIKQSRVLGTRGIVNAIAAAKDRPQVLISASAIGYYGPSDDTPLDEQSPPGHDFLADVVIDWEREARRAESLGVRTVLLRTGVVIGSDKPGLPIPISLRHASFSRPGVVLDFTQGVLPLMAMPFRLFVGGPIGSGKQWMSWIHLEDEIGLILLALENPQAQGPLNATAPQAVTNRAFSATLGRVLHRPSWLPLPAFALRLLVGEVADVIVQGQRVVPKQALALGYQFRYPLLEPALRALIGG